MNFTIVKESKRWSFSVDPFELAELLPQFVAQNCANRIDPVEFFDYDDTYGEIEFEHMPLLERYQEELEIDKYAEELTQRNERPKIPENTERAYLYIWCVAKQTQCSPAFYRVLADYCEEFYVPGIQDLGGMLASVYEKIKWA